MKFIKMQACGNDYAYFFGGIAETELTEAAKKLSDRRFGIGGDGIIILSESAVADVKMRIFNADGSEGATCGNGLRCAAFLARKYLGKGNSVTVETAAGKNTVKLSSVTAHAATAKASFGEIKPFPVPLFLEEELAKVGLYAVKRQFMSVDVGNKHFVYFAGNPIDEIKGIIESFPETRGIYNLEKATAERGDISAEIIERGSGRTLSCGSGAVATAFAAKTLFGEEEEFHVKTDGGTLDVSFVGNKAFLSGEVREIYSGEAYI